MCSFEAQLVKKVVNDIIKTLDKVPLEVAKHPVGLETVKNALIRKLHLKSAETVVKVGIWGLGGIGKTTAAKAVYNEIYDQFKAASFVFNVRTISLTKLQGQILKDLVNYEGEVHSVDKGKSLFRDRLCGMRALVILDDVDNRVQLDALAGDWLGWGSRVIITSRDKHILNAAHISFQCIHEMSGLKRSEGLRLFSWHAFLRPSPIPSYEELSGRVVEACKGHPLSLEVIGAFLYDKQNDTDIECWNETLDNIAVNEDIFKTLHISYSGLSAEEKDIFLDIACFFIGEGKSNPIVFWESMYKKVHTAINNLSMKLLIKINEKGVFDMHDLVRDMGRAIAEQGRTRRWQNDQSSRFLNNISNINISRLRLSKVDSRSLRSFSTPDLCYLHLEHLHIDDIVDSLPPSLRWLRVDSLSFPITMHSSNLFKDLMLAIKKKSTSVVGSGSLRIMDLTDCRSLENLPYTIGHLSHLQSLKLSRFQMVKCIPNTIGNLSQLLSLNLTYCENLSYLPDTIGNLSRLEDLNLTNCEKLSYLPDTIGNLSRLEYLNLTYCEKLDHLPDTIGNLSQLEYLNLTCCKMLINLPDSIGKLSQLKHLSLSWCKKLQSLPETVSNLSKLERLDMLSCYYAWESIPYAILIQSKLRLLGLPPLVEEWRRTLIENQNLMENQGQLEQQTTLESSGASSEAMAEFRAILAGECRTLKFFYQGLRSQTNLMDRSDPRHSIRWMESITAHQTNPMDMRSDPRHLGRWFKFNAAHQTNPMDTRSDRNDISTYGRSTPNQPHGYEE